MSGAAPMIVALDGPSGVGKSTAARHLAIRLGIPYLETGAMYRALGLEVLRRGIDPGDRQAVETVAAELELDLRDGPDGGIEVLLGGRPLGERVRTPEVSRATSEVSAYGGVRRAMVDLQRRWAERRGAVVEGRDIGTKVFPATPYKFFLEAPLAVRVRRRLDQLRAGGNAELSPDEVATEVEARDHRDSNRAESPLAHDDSYVMVDTGGLSEPEVVELLLRRIDEIRSRRPAAGRRR